MDKGAWRATVHGVTKSWTRLNEHTPTERVCLRDQPPVNLVGAEFLVRVSRRHVPSGRGPQSSTRTVSVPAFPPMDIHTGKVCALSWPFEGVLGWSSG